MARICHGNGFNVGFMAFISASGFVVAGLARASTPDLAGQLPRTTWSKTICANLAGGVVLLAGNVLLHTHSASGAMAGMDRGKYLHVAVHAVFCGSLTNSRSSFQPVDCGCRSRRLDRH